MSLMCEECKCTIGIDTGCDNGCECCNDPQYVSDVDQLREMITGAVDKLNSALAIFTDPCDGDSLEFAIGEVEAALEALGHKVEITLDDWYSLECPNCESNEAVHNTYSNGEHEINCTQCDLIERDSEDNCTDCNGGEE